MTEAARSGLDADSGAMPVLSRRLYFAVWRWHFYAGLYVIPFILMLALTGFAMLWFGAVAPESGERLSINGSGAPLAPSALAAAALAAHPGATVTKFVTPWTPENPALVVIASAGESRTLAVDPSSGAVLRDMSTERTWYALANRIHGSLLLGDLGDRLIEIAAGFGVMLVATGLWLWWPRNPRSVALMLLPDVTARGRALWKSLHQVTGFWLSLFLLFFLLSGLAWTGVWGTKLVQAWSTFPAGKFDNVPLSDAKHAHMNHGAAKDVPWALEQTPMPMSGSMAGMPGMADGAGVDLDSVVALARSLGFEGRFQVALPTDETGVFTISQDSQSHDSHRPTGDRTVHVDRYTGKLLADIRFTDYSLAGKAMAVGIALHQGDLGPWNVALNAVYLLGVILLAASGLVMWWRRRPRDVARLGAPPRPGDPRVGRGALALMLLLSLAFPLTALVIAAVLVLDMFVVQRVRPLARLLS